MSESQIAIVTGASSGIGYATATMLKSNGYKVYGLSRRGTAPDGCIGISVDICNNEVVANTFKTIAEKEGRIDILVNNAGMGISGPVEFATKDDIDNIVNVNFLGQVACAKAVIPYMRENRRGSIVFVSSVAGAISIPYQSFYSATKAAVTSFSLALRNELKDFGINVVAILPGDTSTGFTDARKKDELHNEIYDKNFSATSTMEKDERNGMNPQKIAKVICKALKKKSPRPLWTVGGKYKAFSYLFKFLPSSLSYFIVSKIYK